MICLAKYFFICFVKSVRRFPTKLEIKGFLYYFYLIKKLFIFNWRIIFYNIMLVSAIYQHKLAMGIHIYFLIEGQLLYNPVWFLS